MRPVVVAAIVAGVLVLAQLVMLAGIHTALPVLPEPAPGGRPFLIQRIPNGTTLRQSLNVRGDGLHILELAGTVASPAQSGSIDATLVELSGDGVERQVGAITVRVIDACCAFVFEPLEDSAGGRYRLDLRIRDFDASAPLSLQAVLIERGGLTINGRVQAARLTFSGSATGDTALARLQRLAPQRTYFSFSWFLAILLVLDTAIACGAAKLVNVFATRPD